MPWSGNPADRSKLNHIRQQFQTAAGVPPTSTLPHPGYFSDSETGYTPVEGPRFGCGGQRVRGQSQVPMCSSGERRVQDWTERHPANASRPSPAADYYTLGARRQRHLFNGVAPAINTGVIADNPLSANTNRYATFLLCVRSAN